VKLKYFVFLVLFIAALYLLVRLSRRESLNPPSTISKQSYSRSHSRSHFDDARCAALPEIWRHVYHPDRLQVVEQCRSVTGTVVHVRHEADGDLHVQFALDPGQESLLNAGNMRRQHGTLVVELMCEGNVKQADAKDVCSNWHQDLTLASRSHVRITGSYVEDLEHGWMEMHPVSAVEQLP
jgi:hypothetical protein